jgi:hypothetical protein
MTRSVRNGYRWVWGCLWIAAAGGTLIAATADTRLVVAARKNDVTAVRALVQQKADVAAAESDGSTALLWAA